MWVTGKITGCRFRGEKELASGTWRYVEICRYRYIGEQRNKPRALVLHPDHLDDLMIALNVPGTDRSLLDGIAIKTDERCDALHMIKRNGRLRRLWPRNDYPISTNR